MFPLGSLLLMALSGAVVEATDISGDLTDLANWPPCAQTCIPLGLAPPASCNSLSNITCVCENPTFSLSIAGCEKMECSTEELEQIEDLSTPLCAPVGGQPPSVISAINSYLATASLTASGVPTSLPADATAVSAVSAILASATLTPNLGNPNDISVYPVCAQICSNETAEENFCDINDITCPCGAEYRAKTAACEAVTCSPSDRLTVSLLAQELCGPLYSNSSALGSSVSSAIASATAAAVAAVASKDPTNVASYPPCAQSCIKPSLAQSGCESLFNRKCVCQTSSFNADVEPCETASCSAADYQSKSFPLPHSLSSCQAARARANSLPLPREVLTDLAYELCLPVGGFGNVSNVTHSANASTPTPSAFTGGASATVSGRLGWALMALVGALGLLLLPL